MSTREANGKGEASRNAGPDTSACPDEMTLAACLDGKLGDADLARLHLHLEHCGACRRLMEAIRENYAQTNGSGGEEQPEVSRLADTARGLKPR